MKLLINILMIMIFSVPVFDCVKTEADSTGYIWRNITAKAEFPQGYNYPVFVLNDGNLLALNQGGWLSKDGKNWTKTGLAESGLNSAYQSYIQFNGAIYALGKLRGNYESFTIETKISRTTDGKSWETVAEKSNLPQRVFYGAFTFDNKIWMIGGYDGKNYHNDIWTSKDGVKWQRVAEKSAWSPRTVGKVVWFKDRLWIFGGGAIDGDRQINPDSHKEVWSSPDGVNWTQVKIKTERRGGGTPIVFDGKLWFVGANRADGAFDSAVFVSDDAVNWQAHSAPWSPRGAVVVWVFDNKLFMTGGKYSYTEPNGAIKYIYSNDVWALSRKTE